MYSLFLFHATVAFPTYVGCGLKTIQTSATYKNGPLQRQLSVGSPIMNTVIEEGNLPFKFDPPIETGSGYKANTKYTVSIEGAINNGGGAYYVEGGGTLESRIDGCDTTGRISTGTNNPSFVWTSPASGDVNMTYLSANPGQALMSKATISDTSFTFESSAGVGAKELTCKNDSLTGSKLHERWMIFGLALLWVVGVQIASLTQKPRSKAFQALLSVAIVTLAAIFADTGDYGNMQMFTAMAIYLVISALNVYRSAKRFLGDLWRWFVLTFLFVSSETSFHHWCNGEQDWSEMTGDWGDWDSWQGTIPWWAAANILAVWTVYSKKTYKLIYAMQILIGIGLFLGFRAWQLKGKDVPKWMIFTVSAFFFPWVIIGLNALFFRKNYKCPTKIASFQVQMAFVLLCIIVASAAPKIGENNTGYSQSDGYRDISTVVMMTCCAIVGLCWGISSIATQRHKDKVAQNLNYSRLQLCVRVQ